MVKPRRYTVEEIRQRASAAKTRRDQWRSLYQQAYEYAIPNRSLYDGQHEAGTQGKTKMSNVFDSTAVHSTQRFANRMQSGLFPPYKRWQKLEPGNEIPPNKRDQVQSALEIYTDRFFSAIQQSNFDLSMGEFLLDLSVGTAAMLVQRGDALRPVTYTTGPPYLIAIEEGPSGSVDNVYRDMKVRAENIMRLWKDAELPPDIEEKIKEKPQEELHLVECTILDIERGDYCYHVLIEGKDDKQHEIVYRRMKRSPWIVSRFSKIAGEDYGRGPVLYALPDIKTLNKTVELLLKNGSIAVAGIYTATDDGILNPRTVKIIPGSIIPVARNGGPMGPSLLPLPRASDINLSQLIIQNMQMSIKKMLLDDTLPPDNMTARSASEIVARQQELATNLGSAFGRLITETMVPIVTKTLELMDEAGMIDLPLKVNGLEVKVVPTGPLAMAQNMDDVDKAVQWMTLVSQLGPAGIASARIDALVDYIGDKLGVPQSLRTIAEERQAMAGDLAAAAQAGIAAPPIAGQTGGNQSIATAPDRGMQALMKS